MAECLDGVREFLTIHYFASDRADTPFWRANKFDLTLSDDIKHKLEMYKAGLPVNQSIAEDNYYSEFEEQIRNLWTNESYYCILAGMNWFPKPVPSIRYRPESLRKADEVFEGIKKKSSELLKTLPTNRDFLRQLHGK